MRRGCTTERAQAIARHPHQLWRITALGIALASPAVCFVLAVFATGLTFGASFYLMVFAPIPGIIAMQQLYGVTGPPPDPGSVVELGRREELEWAFADGYLYWMTPREGRALRKTLLPARVDKTVSGMTVELGAQPTMDRHWARNLGYSTLLGGLSLYIAWGGYFILGGGYSHGFMSISSAFLLIGLIWLVMLTIPSVAVTSIVRKAWLTFTTPVRPEYVKIDGYKLDCGIGTFNLARPCREAELILTNDGCELRLKNDQQELVICGPYPQLVAVFDAIAQLPTDLGHEEDVPETLRKVSARQLREE